MSTNTIESPLSGRADARRNRDVIAAALEPFKNLAKNWWSHFLFTTIINHF
jgi:hypothetical protein